VAKPTERVLVIAKALAGPVDEINQPLARCLVAITTRLRLAMVALPPDDAGADDAVFGGPPPTMDQLSVMSFRDLGKLKHIVTDERMRQFMGLWWDESEEHQREVLIFDSSSRRRAFQQALRMVDRAQYDGRSTAHDSSRGIPQLPLRKEIIDTLQGTCQLTDVRNTALVSATFVRSQRDAAASSWTTGWSAASINTQAEVLLLTVGTVVVISLDDFLRQYARPDDAEVYAAQAADFTLMETDSEDENSLNDLQPSGPRQEFTIPPAKALYSGPWKLKDLQGVWFLAEAEPKIKLKFQGIVMILFPSDGERQRWRRHLAAVLANQERRQQDDRSANQGWSVLATGKTEITEVRKFAMTHPHRSLATEHPRALMNATKAAG